MCDHVCSYFWRARGLFFPKLKTLPSILDVRSFLLKVMNIIDVPQRFFFLIF